MRYAIYFTPAPQSALWRFGSSAIGYDAVARETCPFPAHGLWQEAWFLRELDNPARYGFHATLKAPFELAAGTTEATLLERVAALSAWHAPILLPALKVTLLNAFAALRPVAEDAELNRLAAACVRDLDDLRAPLIEADRARRLSQALTTRQLMNLQRWGYPYVLEDFRFHMTLTGAIPAAMRSRVLDSLEALYRGVNGPMLVDAISVLSQPTRESRFGVLARFPLTAAVPAISLGR